MINQLFLVYISVAITYNLVSIGYQDFTEKQLSPNDPLSSTVMLTTLYLTYTVPVHSSSSSFFRCFLLFVFLILILRFGVFRHLLNSEKEQYVSSTSRLSAVAINIFGTSLLSIELFLRVL